MALRIGKNDFQEKVRNSELTVLVDFYSDSCTACRMLTPALGEAEEVLGQEVLFYKINTNFEQELAEEYKILANPTLVIFQSGQELDRRTGTMDLDELLAWLKPRLHD